MGSGSSIYNLHATPTMPGVDRLRKNAKLNTDNVIALPKLDNIPDLASNTFTLAAAIRSSVDRVRLLIV